MTRVVVVGATGNVGSRVIEALRHRSVEDIVGVARRVQSDAGPSSSNNVSWVSCDIAGRDAQRRLTEVFDNADAVVHLGWQIQPGRNLSQLERANVGGSRNVAAAVVAAGVPALVYASSVGAYSAGPKDRQVDESWPTDGTPTSTYARQKAAVERILDDVESQHPTLRIVRFRPGLIFQNRAASEIARYFLGPFLPLSALRRRLIPLVPAFPRLAFQAVHTEDVGRAFAAAVSDESISGAFNLAAEPVLDAAALGAALQARPVPVPFAALRAGADLAFRARLIPTDAGWLDMAAAVPLMSTERARAELGWSPRHSSTEALLELLDGMNSGAGAPTPPLRPAPGVLGRISEAARVAVLGGPGRQNP
jgi:nucleoside-diphosphate-sugar epimerase